MASNRSTSRQNGHPVPFGNLGRYSARHERQNGAPQHLAATTFFSRSSFAKGLVRKSYRYSSPSPPAPGTSRQMGHVSSSREGTAGPGEASSRSASRSVPAAAASASASKSSSSFFVASPALVTNSLNPELAPSSDRSSAPRRSSLVAAKRRPLRGRGHQGRAAPADARHAPLQRRRRRGLLGEAIRFVARPEPPHPSLGDAARPRGGAAPRPARDRGRAAALGRRGHAEPAALRVGRRRREERRVAAHPERGHLHDAPRPRRCALREFRARQVPLQVANLQRRATTVSIVGTFASLAGCATAAGRTHDDVRGAHGDAFVSGAVFDFAAHVQPGERRQNRRARASARASRPRGGGGRPGSAVSPLPGRSRARAREEGRPARRRWGRASRRTRRRAWRWIPGTRLGPRRRGRRARRRPPPGRPPRPRASRARPGICLRRATPSAGSTLESRRRCPGRGLRCAPVAGRTRPRR